MSETGNVIEIGQITRLNMGYVGEGMGRMHLIDMREWLERWPDAAIGVLVERPDGYKYIATTTLEDGILRWIIRKGETIVAGKGAAQIMAVRTEDDFCYKTRVVQTYIAGSIDEEIDGEIQDPMDTWVEQAIQAAGDAQAAKDAAEKAAEDAAGSANAAAKSAEDAAKSAEEAKEAAEKAQGGMPDGGDAHMVLATNEAGEAMWEGAFFGVSDKRTILPETELSFLTEGADENYGSVFMYISTEERLEDTPLDGETVTINWNGETYASKPVNPDKNGRTWYMGNLAIGGVAESDYEAMGGNPDPGANYLLIVSNAHTMAWKTILYTTEEQEEQKVSITGGAIKTINRRYMPFDVRRTADLIQKQDRPQMVMTLDKYGKVGWEPKPFYDSTRYLATCTLEYLSTDGVVFTYLIYGNVFDDKINAGETATIEWGGAKYTSRVADGSGEYGRNVLLMGNIAYFNELDQDEIDSMGGNPAPDAPYAVLCHLDATESSIGVIVYSTVEVENPTLEIYVEDVKKIDAKFLPGGGEGAGIDDTRISRETTWSSKAIVDELCPSFEATGNPVVCHPVGGYPLGVTVDVEPVQAGEGDPSPDNIRPITVPTKIQIGIRPKFESIQDIASYVRSHTVEENENMFPYGDQIIIPWKDMDDANHNTDEKAYQVPLDILGHRMVTLETGEEVPGMFVQWHFASPYVVQFSHQQAFMNCVDELPSGDYYVTIGRTNWGFTLAQAVPAGGRISGFEGGTNNATTKDVKTWATANSTTPQEMVTATSGVATGTHLGTMAASSSADGLNGYHAVYYGHNRWSTCALRQHLNSKGANWWKSKENFDIRPDQYAKQGFMSGFNEDFLAAIRPVKVQTALNTVEGYSETADITYDRFFPLSLEEMYIVAQANGVEGAYFPYWKERLGLTTPGGLHPTAHPNIVTTAINAQSSAQRVRLRSATRGDSYSAWSVYASGHVGTGSNAGYALRSSPVCVIC